MDENAPGAASVGGCDPYFRSRWPGHAHERAARFLSLGCNFLYPNHTALILMEIPTFANVTGSQEVNAVPAKPSVYASILKLFTWDEFNRGVKTCEARGRP
jgi:hypothetical protein